MHPASRLPATTSGIHKYGRNDLLLIASAR
jgi:hypothetical protein